MRLRVRLGPMTHAAQFGGDSIASRAEIELTVLSKTLPMIWIAITIIAYVNKYDVQTSEQYHQQDANRTSRCSQPKHRRSV